MILKVTKIKVNVPSRRHNFRKTTEMVQIDPQS